MNNVQEKYVDFKENAKQDKSNILFGRIYKSLPLNDFMDMTSFLFAQGGLCLSPCISDFNYEMHNSNLKEEEKKLLFMKKAINEAIVAKKYGVSIDVIDMGAWGYYSTFILRKE